MSNKKSPPTRIQKGRIIFNFHAQGKNELSVKRGEIVIVEDHTDTGDGWTFCKIASNLKKSGYVPSQYVDFLYERVHKKSPYKPKKKVKKVNLREHRESLAEVCTQVQYMIYRKRFSKYFRGKQFKKQLTRLHNLKETLSTEGTYLKQLNFCIDEFKKPIQETAIIKDQEQRIIFSDMERIRDISQNLYESLTESMKTFPSVRIGPSFKSISPFFKMYKTYINNYEAAVKMVEKCVKKNSTFQKFLENVSRNTPSFARSYQLDDFLILPIQRIPRYKMLLSNILKLTDPSHGEYIELENALKIVSDVASFINHAKREEFATTTSIELSKVLKGRYSTLIQSYRKFFEEAKVEVVSEDLEIAKGSSGPWDVILFSDVLILKKGKSKDKVFFLFLLFTNVSTHSENDKMLILKSLVRGRYVEVSMEFDNMVKRDSWMKMLGGNIETTVASMRSKGFKSVDVLVAGASRVQTSIKKSNKLERYHVIVSQLKQKADELKRIEKSIRESETKLRKWGEQIQASQLMHHKLGNVLEKLEKGRNRTRTELVQTYKTIQRRDGEMMTVLGDEMTAFKEIFASEPVPDEAMPEKVKDRWQNTSVKIVL